MRAKRVLQAATRNFGILWIPGTPYGMPLVYTHVEFIYKSFTLL